MEDVFELVVVCVPNLWQHFNDGACDDVCENKWSSEAKEMHGGGMMR